MSEFNINMQGDSSVRLPTAGKYCDRDIVITASGGGNAEEKLKASEYPDYITPEVLRIVNEVNKVRTDDSIVFVAMSDSHYVGEQELGFYDDKTNASALQANRAAKVLAYLLDVDFFAHLGDVSCGADSTTPDMLKKQIEGFNSYFREAKSDLPVFVCIGNHDTGIYYHSTQLETNPADKNIYTLDGNYLYNNFTALSASDNTVFGGIEYDDIKAGGGYCYRDFPEKKLRVFMLNTSEKLVARQIDNTTFGAQRSWLAKALNDLNLKEDAEEWGFIILCHYPADYGATMKLSQLLEAYVNGKSFIITDPTPEESSYSQGDGTNETVYFTGKNGAKFIAQFHGHIHNFLTSKLYSNASGSLVQYDAWRICTPNGQFNRENYYTTDGNGINFAEDREYSKNEDGIYPSEDDTSFVVNVINPSEQRIHSFCYGAGYDRVIGYGGTPVYSISTTLSNVSISEEATSIEEGQVYSATLTATENDYSINFVKITMGGVDRTEDFYSDGIIYIESVTGNIVIEATAIFEFSGTNLLAESTDIDGSVYNGVGYKEHTYIASGDGVAGTISPHSGTNFTSGFIPCTLGQTLYFKDCIFRDKQGYDRFAFYEENDKGEKIIAGYVYSTNEAGFSGQSNVTYGNDGNIKSFSINQNFGNEKGITHIRFCCRGLGENSIVASEPITSEQKNEQIIDILTGEGE